MFRLIPWSTRTFMVFLPSLIDPASILRAWKSISGRWSRALAPPGLRADASPGQRSRSPSAGDPAVRTDAEHTLRGFAEDALLQRLVEVRAIERLSRLRIADRERLIRAEHDARGASLLREVFEGVGVEHAGVEVHRLESFSRVGVLALRDLVISRQAPERVRQGA